MQKKKRKKKTYYLFIKPKAWKKRSEEPEAA